jgi:hypothetical protein
MVTGDSNAGRNPRVMAEKFIDFNHGEPRIKMPSKCIEKSVKICVNIISLKDRDPGLLTELV